VLASLLRRLAEVHQLAEPQALVVGSSDAASSSLTSRLRQPGKAAPQLDREGHASSSGLAVASALGAGSEAIMIFLASFLRSSSSATLVLFVDQQPSPTDLEETGVDLQRVTFETISQPLPLPWSTLPWSDASIWLFHNYLQRVASRTEASQLVQLSEVSGVAFQADPFVWASGQQQGLHMFADEPGITVASDTKLWKVVELCYGPEASRIQAQPMMPQGYLIGTFSDLQRYTEHLVQEVLAHSACHKRGVAAAIGNYVAHAAHEGFEIHVHENRRGPVWTGGHVQKQAILADSEDELINEDGYRYAVIRQYDQHEEVWKNLLKKFIKRRQENGVLDCSAFQVQPGDMRGYDLTHLPAETRQECCVACYGDSGCGSFVFSESRKHCWLKVPGGIRTAASPGDDIQVGTKNAPPGTGVI